MLYMNSVKHQFFCFFIIICSVNRADAQGDSSSFERTRDLFVGIDASYVKDIGQQANYFRGYNEVFGLSQLLSIPQVKSELYTKTGRTFTLDSYPSPMRYNAGLGIGLNVLYCMADINLILNGSYSKLVTEGIFTLSAEDPANPSGDPIIKTEKISGTERRTWIKGGMQFRNEINERNDFFFELAPLFFFQKALKNEVNIEGSNYSILVNNPGYVFVQTSFVGYGLNLGVGIQTMFLKNKMTHVGVNFNASKLKMVETNKLNYILEFYLSVFL